MVEGKVLMESRGCSQDRSSQLFCRTLVSRMSQRVTSLQVLRICVFFLMLLHELEASLNIEDILVLYG